MRVRACVLSSFTIERERPEREKRGLSQASTMSLKCARFSKAFWEKKVDKKGLFAPVYSPALTSAVLSLGKRWVSLTGCRAMGASAEGTWLNRPPAGTPCTGSLISAQGTTTGCLSQVAATFLPLSSVSTDFLVYLRRSPVYRLSQRRR